MGNSIIEAFKMIDSALQQNGATQIKYSHNETSVVGYFDNGYSVIISPIITKTSDDVIGYHMNILHPNNIACELGHLLSLSIDELNSQLIEISYMNKYSSDGYLRYEKLLKCI
jgi:hypothetical protein